jgi:hypothetical protein
MPIVERLEFPKKYKWKDTMILFVIVGIIGGILITKHNNSTLRKNVIIHSVGFDEYDKQFIRIGYDIENKGRTDQRVALLARVTDDKGEELTSIFFYADISAQTRQYQSKVIDKLNRPLREGEIPYKATIEIRTRDIFSY